MTIELRPYQWDVVEEYERMIAAGTRRILIAAPTGAGKTIIASEIIRRAVAAYKQILFIAHRNELLTQARDKLKTFGIDPGIIKSGRDKDARPLAAVQVAGIQTLHARAVRAKTMELPPGDILFVDEAHHVRARTYSSIVEACPNAIIIGLTATPCRGDGRGLGNVFGSMIECPQISELIKLGHLVKLKIFAPPSPDLRGVEVASTGDYVINQLSDRMNTDPLVGDIVEHWLRHSQRRRTVIFAVDIKHSVHIVEQLRKSEIKAEHLDGTTPQADRDAILGRLASGETEVVSNCMVLTEGFDLPDIGSAHEARLAEHREPFCECTACGHLRMRGMACDNCGWEPKRRGSGVDYVDQDLVELGATERAEIDRLTFYRELRGHQLIARKRDGTLYAAGWAAQRFKQKFGYFPPWSWNNQDFLEPSFATQRWIRSRQIAWAKRRVA